MASTLLIGCAPVAELEEELISVEDGKVDNYYSNVATEYEATGTIPVELTAAEFADAATQQDKITRRLTATAFYLTAYLSEKLGPDHDFTNSTYGGFKAMVRNYTVESKDVARIEDGKYSVKFTVDLAGPNDLLRKLPRPADVTGSGVFDFQMPIGASLDPANVSFGGLRTFDPSKVDAATLETVRVTSRALPTVKNAYPHYKDFFADGVFDITFFQGHDYNAGRADLELSRKLFDILKRKGFTPPAATYEELGAQSGPFVRTMKAGGKDVRVEVRIFHSDMFTTDRKGQHDLAVSELVSRDVFVYDGHAGPYYGFYLDGGFEATVGEHEFKTLPFTDKQQMLMAFGCQTYSQYADIMYTNDVKSEANLDVITTVNYSYGQGSPEVLDQLLTMTADQHVPRSMYEIIASINANYTNQAMSVFYGVMGADGNPQLHPYADASKIGASCVKHSDCGGEGNRCIVDAGKKTCGAITLAAAACPAGSSMRAVRNGLTISYNVCLKR